MVSMIKRNSCGKALDAARMARDMLGGEVTYTAPCSFELLPIVMLQVSLPSMHTQSWVFLEKYLWLACETVVTFGCRS